MYGQESALAAEATRTNMMLELVARESNRPARRGGGRSNRRRDLLERNRFTREQIQEELESNRTRTWNLLNDMGVTEEIEIDSNSDDDQ